MAARGVTLGFIGLGDMGRPMASRLLATGNRVIAWNRSPGRLAMLQAEGAIRARSPAEVFASADLIGLCLTSHEAVEQIGWGGAGLFSAPAGDRKYIADFSTGSAEAARSFAARASQYNTSWVDAPVSGGVSGADAGSLIVFAGGDAEAISALQPLFAPLARRVTHMGAVGSGQTTKICNQMIVATNLLLLAETIAMARRNGVDVAALPGALQGGFADSMPLQIFGPKMAAHRFEPRLGSVALMQKDVGLALDMAARVLADTPLLSLAGDRYAQLGSIHGSGGSDDVSTVIRLYESSLAHPDTESQSTGPGGLMDSHRERETD